MSPRRKGWYLSAMVVGAIALAADRWVFSGNAAEPSAAMALGGDGLLPAIPLTGGEQAAELSIPELPFPKNLKPPDPQSQIRDLFAPSESGADRGSPGSTTDKSRTGAVPSGEAATGTSAMFVTRNRLDGVMIDQRLRIAVVDGVWVRIGEPVDGCTLSEVLEDEVRFECIDGDATLEMPEAKISGRD